MIDYVEKYHVVDEYEKNGLQHTYINFFLLLPFILHYTLDDVQTREATYPIYSKLFYNHKCTPQQQHIILIRNKYSYVYIYLVKYICIYVCLFYKIFPHII